jgi:hypothetical protein
MLEELAASLVVRRPVEAPAPAPGCSPTTAAASREVEASLLDNHSPAKVVQWMMDLHSLLPVQGQPHVTPRQEGQHGVADAKVSPDSSNTIPLGADVATPPQPAEGGSFAAKRLKSFTDKILHEVASPLLPQPLWRHNQSYRPAAGGSPPRRFHACRLLSGERC